MLSSNKNAAVQMRIKKNADLYGNKAANLQELKMICEKTLNSAFKVQVPEIFPIEDKVIQTFLDTYASSWRKKWHEFIQEQKNNKTLTEKSLNLLKELQSIVTDCFNQHPDEVAKLLVIDLPSDSLVMVRSSGEEDRVDVANPGGNKSVAAVKLDNASLAKAIGIVVASYLSEKSLTQRLLSHDSITKDPFMPVLIQKMIGEELNGSDEAKNKVISGVMYANNTGITRLDVAPGHGELIVNGRELFDTFEVTKDNIVHPEIHHKRSRLVPTEIKNEDGSVTRQLTFKDNDKKMQSAPSLSTGIAKEIARVGRKIARHYGMPMDVEFVYQPADDMLSIVQARPIPQGVNQKITPSAIAPEKWHELKKDPTIRKEKSPVISPAGREAKVITKSEQVILASTIETALKVYLKTAEQQDIRTVIVKNHAPSTSHEAAQFNLMGVPVFEGPTEIIESWLKESKPVIIADSQHQHIVNVTKKIHEQKTAEKELKDDKVIVDGLFSSSLSMKKTLLPIDFHPNEIIASTIKKYLAKPAQLNPEKPYSAMLECFETLEAAKINDTNEEAFAALQTIADLFKRIATWAVAKEKNAPHRQLFVNAMLSIAEIDHCLADFSNGKQNQAQLLDLINKLKAVIINPGETNLYSDSINQIAAHIKELRDNKIQEEKLTESQQAYFNEFLKLNVLALNSKTHDAWIIFARYCAKSDVRQQMLSEMLLFALENNIPSELINQYFIGTVEKSQNQQNPEHAILIDLYQMMKQSKQAFSRYYLNENNKVISTWEKRINDWSRKDKFEKLYKDFNAELVPLIAKISLDEKMSGLTQQVVLKQVQMLADVIDKTIKSMKGSLGYKDQEKLLVERFVKLLTPYHQLMDKWMRMVPEEFYNHCAKEILANKNNDKISMIEKIASVFQDKSKRTDAGQLRSSGYLSVAAVKVGTNASFARQFCDKISWITLEDLFSYFHQNILASTVILSKKNSIQKDYLPEVLQPLFQKLSENKKLDLLGVTHHHPMIELEFNIPMENHSGKMIMTLNTKTQTLDLHWNFFGGNWNNRMDTLAYIAELEGLLLGGEISQKPYYNNDSYNIEFAWRVNSNQILHLSGCINDIINHYDDVITKDENNIARANQSLMGRHFKNKQFEQLTHTFSADTCKLISNKIKAIDNRSLLGYFSNPEMASRFSFQTPKVDENAIYDNLDTFTFEQLETFIAKGEFKIYPATKFTSDLTFLEQLIAKFSNEDALKFIVKYKPYLTIHQNAVSMAFEKNPPDQTLIQYLIDHGAPTLELSADAILNGFRSEASVHYLNNVIEKWSKNEISQWLYTRLDKISSNAATKLCNYFINHVNNRIDFNYKVNYFSDADLFEVILNKTYLLENMTEQDVKEFIDKNKIVLTNRTRVLSTALSSKCYILAKVFLQKGATLPFSGVTEVQMKDALISPDGRAFLKSWLDSLSSETRKEMLNKHSAVLKYSVIAEWYEQNDKSLYDNLDKLTFEQLDKLIEKWDIKIDAASQWDQTFLEKLITNFSGEDALKFIEKYKPDLTKQHHAVSKALAKKPADAKLIQHLIDQGAPIVELSASAIVNGVIAGFGPVITNVVKKWDGNKISSSFHAILTDPSVTAYNGFCQSFINCFEDKIDFNYKPVGENFTVFAALFKRTNILENMTEQALVEFLVKNKIDMTRQTEILNIALPGKLYKLAKFFVQKGAPFSPTPQEIEEACKHDDGKLFIQCWLDTLSREKRREILDRYSFAFLDFAEWIEQDEKSLHDNLDKLNFDKLDKLIEKWEIKVDDVRKWDQRFLYKLIQTFTSEDAIKYIEKYKPELRIHSLTVTIALEKQPPDAKLIQYLIDHSAPVADLTGSAMLNGLNVPEIKPVLMNTIQKWDSHKISRWLSVTYMYNSAYTCNRLSNYFIDNFKDRIDFNNKAVKGDVTLFEQMFEKTSFLEQMNEQDFINFLNKIKVDITKQPKMLNIALKYHCYTPAKVFIKKGATFSGMTAEQIQVAVNHNEKGKAFVKLWLDSLSHENRTAILTDLKTNVADERVAELIRQYDIADDKKPQNTLQLGSLESMVKQVFVGTHLASRIQHIELINLAGVETFFEFKDCNAPLTQAQKDDAIQFFKEKLGLEAWRVGVREPYKSHFNARIDIFLNTDQLKNLMTKYIATQNLAKRSSSSSSPTSSGFSQSFLDHFVRSKIDPEVTAPTVMIPRKIIP